MPRGTKAKIILAGRSARAFKYEKTVWYGTLSSRRKKKTNWVVKDEATKLAHRLRARKSAMTRARSHVYNLVSTNAWFWKNSDGNTYLPVFLTLTIAENEENIKRANSMFNKFMKRLNYFITGSKKAIIKYVAVMEFQQRGAIHYHVVLFNMEYVFKDDLAEVWGLGFIKIKSLDAMKNVAGYITKYMSKNVDDARLDGKKRYFCSKNLLRPKTITRHEKALDLIMRIPKQYITKDYPFESLYHGKVQCIEYDFGKETTIFDVVDLPNKEDYS
jgi:hypothetical protein